MSVIIEQFRPSVQQITEAQRLPCPQSGCQSAFTNSGQLHMHLTQHHKLLVSSCSSATPSSQSPTIQRQYFCPISVCKYHHRNQAAATSTTSVATRHFSALKLLKQHYLKVHADRSLNCPRCPRTFAAARLLRAHQHQCGRTFQCPKCGWKYHTHEALQTHCRRKGHPQPAKESVQKTGTAVAAEELAQIKTELSELVRVPTEGSGPRRLRSLAPKPDKEDAAQMNHLVSQTTQTLVAPRSADVIRVVDVPTDNLFLNSWQNTAEAPDDGTVDNPTAVNTMHCSVQTEINLNNLHFLNAALDANSLSGFFPMQQQQQQPQQPSTAADAEHLCHHIETQTDFDRAAAELESHVQRQRQLQRDQQQEEQVRQQSVDADIAGRLAAESGMLLYTDGHTQTVHCDDEHLLFGWTHIETQTCWSPSPHVRDEDFPEFLVSTETQTSLPPN